MISTLITDLMMQLHINMIIMLITIIQLQTQQTAASTIPPRLLRQPPRSSEDLLGFLVYFFGFWSLVFGFWYLGFGFGFLVLGLGFQCLVFGFWFWVVS